MRVESVDHRSVFSVPAVPVGVSPAASAEQTAYTEGITRKLCSAAYARPDRLAGLHAGWSAKKKAVKAAVRSKLRLKGTQAGSGGPAGSDRRPPSVVTGEEFALWVRRRIKGAPRPGPVFGFNQQPVVQACDEAVRQSRWRRSCLVLLLVLAGWAGWSGLLSVAWATGVAGMGVWLICAVDRLVAQQRMNALLAGELAPEPSAEEVPVLPYIREMRNTGPRYRFVGAGLQSWPAAVIGIDVEPAPPGQDDRDQPAPAGVPGVPSTAGDMAAAVLAALGKHGGQGDPRKPLKHFGVADLHAHVAAKLKDPAPAHSRSHPVPRTEILGIAGVAANRWDALDAAAWEAMHALAAGDRASTRLPGADIARRYIWARITDWSGELIVSVLVRFEYQGGFLRVVVLPHIMAPLNPAVAGLTAADVRTPAWIGTTLLNSLGDVAAGINRIVRRTPRQVPELDTGSGPVSLREVYSLRWIDDMHMYDDARYYVQMMQRRVFDSTEIFLRDHNVDIAAYQQQASAIYNFGVMNGGTMTGPVQAAPFSQDPTMN